MTIIEDLPRCESRQQFSLLYMQTKRSKLITFLLWFFLGFIGAHNFYLRDRHQSDQAAYGLFKVVIAILLLTPLAIYAFIVLSGWWLVDLFLFWNQADIFNEKLKQRLGYYELY